MSILLALESDFSETAYIARFFGEISHNLLCCIKCKDTHNYQYRLGIWHSRSSKQKVGHLSSHPASSSRCNRLWSYVRTLIFSQKFVSRWDELTKIMPHSGGVIRAYRHRRVVKRRQKIGPDVIDFRGGMPQGVYDIWTCSPSSWRKRRLTASTGKTSPPIRIVEAVPLNMSRISFKRLSTSS